jgi:segregation and condensation protein B
VTEARLVPVGPGPVEEPAPAFASGASAEDEVADEAAEAEVAGASVADIEALLFVAERPLGRVELRSLTGLSTEEVDARLGDLEMQLRERGIRLVSSGEQVMLGTSPESGRLIARYLGVDSMRLSPAALETLAIVAYRQPVTRGAIERIRGVDSGHVVRGLLHRRLIGEQGRADSPGRPILYVTSMAFMERFGLTSLDDLPPIDADVAARLADAELAETSDTAETDAEPSESADTSGPFDEGAAIADA